MPHPLKVLLVEDNPDDAAILLHELRSGGFDPEWQRVDTEAAYVAQLDVGLDLVLSDYQMPQFTGLRALELLQQRGLDVPFILISGTIGEEMAVQAMKSGAADYLLKDRLARLGQAVGHALESRRRMMERRRADHALLTAEALNRGVLNSMLAHIAVLDRTGTIVAVNEQWRRFACDNGAAPADVGARTEVGTNYLAVCRDVLGAEAAETMRAFEGLQAVLSGGRESFNLEYPCHAPDRPRWFLLSATPLKTPEGGAVVSHFDISDRKLAEEALSKSELVQRRLAEGLAVAQAVGNLGSWETDLSTFEVVWSEQTHRIFETDSTTFKPTHEGFLALVHPEDRDAVARAFRIRWRTKT